MNILLMFGAPHFGLFGMTQENIHSQEIMMPFNLCVQVFVYVWMGKWIGWVNEYSNGPNRRMHQKGQLKKEKYGDAFICKTMVI